MNTMIMRKMFLNFVLSTACLLGISQVGTHQMMQSSTEFSGFIENKGQFVDQHGKSNPDVKYFFKSPGLNIQIKEGGFSYDTYIAENISPAHNSADDKHNIQYRYERVDIDFEGCSDNAKIISGIEKSVYYNYYTSGVSGNGIKRVNLKGKVIYRALYKGIDLVFKVLDNGSVEYSFHVKAGADPGQIKMRYSGADHIAISGNKIITTLKSGRLITEDIPACFIKETGKDVTVTTQVKDNLLTFHASDYDNTKTLVIDPIPAISWSTYYGGTQYDTPADMVIDDEENIYILGMTYSTGNIATTGAWQTTITGGEEMFIAKFDSSGELKYATYFGGSDYESMYGAINLDASGNIYITGSTTSDDVINTLSTTRAGETDVYIQKFDNTGSRVWGRYYGGNRSDEGLGIDVDASGYIYICGKTNSQTGTGIATTGAFQENYSDENDAFIARFSSSGDLLWGTYYGDAEFDDARSIMLDADGENMYITGYTQLSGTTFGTSGAYMENFQGGINDAYLAKFDTAGTRVWSTYFGGSQNDQGNDLTVDYEGNIYLTGWTQSSGLGTSGAFHEDIVGSNDAYIGKFSPDGTTLIWATYYGGDGSIYGSTDIGNHLDCDTLHNVYLAGYTMSDTSIHTINCPHPGLPADAYIVKFDKNGTRQWGTYFGGEKNELAERIAVNKSGDNVYLTGSTDSEDMIATRNVHMDTVAGSKDIFLTRFTGFLVTPPATPDTIFGPDSVCYNSSETYSVTNDPQSDYYTWKVPDNAEITSGQGTHEITVTFDSTSGTISVRAEKGNRFCAPQEKTITVYSCGPAPVELIEFSGFFNKQGEAVLKWSTASERNNDYFAVERSSDCGAFETIGVINGNGTVNTPSAYTFTDKYPLNDTNYYRLKQFDFNGSFEYSNIISLNNNARGFTCYPNPVNDYLFIQTDKYAGNLLIEVLDIQSRAILQKNITPENNAARLDCSSLCSGVYLIKLTEEQGHKKSIYFIKE